MISQLTGTVSYVDTRFIIVEVSGVGFRVFVTTEALSRLSKKKEQSVSLWIHLAVREDSLNLYGFLEKEELDFFELLLSVSGIGPKTALGILSVATVKQLKYAASSGEVEYLTKLSGIGKKLAEKIVAGLKDKVAAMPDGGTPYIKDETEALEALEALGYSLREAREALKKLPKGVIGTGELVKQVLKMLGK